VFTVIPTVNSNDGWFGFHSESDSGNKTFSPLLIVLNVTMRAGQASRLSAVSIRNVPPRPVVVKKEPKWRGQRLSSLTADNAIFDEKIVPKLFEYEVNQSDSRTNCGLLCFVKHVICVALISAWWSYYVFDSSD
jgi:hypothetical protein